MYQDEMATAASKAHANAPQRTPLWQTPPKKAIIKPPDTFVITPSQKCVDAEEPDEDWGRMPKSENAIMAIKTIKNMGGGFCHP